MCGKCRPFPPFPLRDTEAATPVPCGSAACHRRPSCRRLILCVPESRAYPAASNGERPAIPRSEEHTSELQSLMRISYAVFCLKKKKQHKTIQTNKFIV